MGEAGNCMQNRISNSFSLYHQILSESKYISFSLQIKHAKSIDTISNGILCRKCIYYYLLHPNSDVHCGKHFYLTRHYISLRNYSCLRSSNDDVFIYDAEGSENHE